MKPRDWPAFVAAWMEAHRAGEGLKGVAARTGLTTVSAQVYGTRLRRSGVRLPRLYVAHPKANPLDVDALNALIKERS